MLQFIIAAKSFSLASRMILHCLEVYTFSVKSAILIEILNRYIFISIGPIYLNILVHQATIASLSYHIFIV